MKKWIGVLLILMLAAAAHAEGTRAFVLSTAGDVDPSVAEQVRSHLEEFGSVRVRLGDPVAMEAGETLEDVGRSAARALGENDYAVIVLARPTDDQPQGICLPEDHFAILNLSKLQVGVDQKMMVRRADREAMRVMAWLLDMSQCPFPLCVLVHYDTVEDLDTMSMSFCPPCHDRFLRLADKAGLELLEPVPRDAPAAEAQPE